MILGDREQDRDPGPESLRERELERRDLGHEHVDVVVDGFEQRAADVARRCRARTPDASSIAATSVVTVVLPFVPVTATIGTRARSAARSISLRTGTPARRAAEIIAMRVADERARHHEIEGAGQRVDLGRTGSVHHGRADCPHRIDVRAVHLADGPVVERDDVPPLGAQPARHRHTGCSKSDDERARITRARTGGSRRRRCRCRSRRRCRRTARSAR